MHWRVKNGTGSNTCWVSTDRKTTTCWFWAKQRNIFNFCHLRRIWIEHFFLFSRHASLVQWKSGAFLLQAVFLSLLLALELSRCSGQTGPHDCCQLKSESPHQTTSFTLRSHSCILKCRLARGGRVLFVWGRLKKTHREAELFASNFTGTEIFTQTFLLWQHERTAFPSSSVPAHSASSLRWRTELVHKSHKSGWAQKWISGFDWYCDKFVFYLVSRPACQHSLKYNYMKSEETFNEFPLYIRFLSIIYWFQGRGGGGHTWLKSSKNFPTDNERSGF